MLTLRPFFEASSRGQLVDKIRHEHPPPLSKSDRSIPQDLETIVLKALAKEPSSRYHTAEGLAEDLRRFLAKELNLATDRWDELRNVAIAAHTLPDLYPVQEWKGFPLGSTAVDFDDNLEIYARTDEVGNCSIRRIESDLEIVRLSGQGIAVRRFLPHLSRDGRFVVVHDEGSTARLWRIERDTPQLVLTLQDVWLLDFHNNGREIAFAHTDGTITDYDVSSSQLLHRLEPNALTREIVIALHPKEPLVAVGSYPSSSEVVRPSSFHRSMMGGLTLPMGGSRAQLAERGPSPDALASDPPARRGRVMVIASRTTTSGVRVREDLASAQSCTALLIGERSGTYRWPIRRDETNAGLIRIGPPQPLTLPPGGFGQSRDGKVRIAGFRAVGNGQPWAGVWIQHAGQTWHRRHATDSRMETAEELRQLRDEARQLVHPERASEVNLKKASSPSAEVTE